MSTFARREIPCACGATLSVDLADSIHAVNAPAVLAALRDGTFHRFRCDRCDRSIRVEKEVAYTDFARRQWFLVFPPHTLRAFAEIDRFADDCYRATMIERCAPVVREWAADMTRRTVFGLASLREKLRLAELELDDRVIEMVKLQIAAQRTLSPEAHFVFDRRDDLTLVFVLGEPGSDRIDELVVPARAYARLAGHGAELAAAAAPVCHGAIVDWRLPLLPRAATAAGQPHEVAP
jgi:hypothetical protein